MRDGYTLISNKELKDMEIVKHLEESGLLINDISETFENETNFIKVGFFSMLLGTSAATLLGNLLTDK